jgi:inhibitor of cysteine peptidase
MERFMHPGFAPFAAIAVLVCLAAAAFGDPAMSRDTKVTDSDNGRAVTLKTGDILTVSLVSTPGTGYGWNVARLDSQVLQEAGKPTIIHDAHPIPGAPAAQVFRFTAAGVGATTLELDYVRPWEKGLAPARIFRLSVTVQ